MTPAPSRPLPAFSLALAPPSERTSLAEIADAMAAVILSARQQRAERAAAAEGDEAAEAAGKAKEARKAKEGAGCRA